ncbi:hypothetical protein [Bacillus aerolatus]|nr:hypothetical protein [Bacillus aerolatus]
MNPFFIEEVLRLEAYAKSLNVKIPDPTGQLDQLFRDALEEVWN